MANKKTIRKVGIIMLWALIAGGMISVLMLAMNDEKEAACCGVDIYINSKKASGTFFNEKDVKTLLNKIEGGAIKGTLKKNIDLAILEQGIRKNKWVSDVKIFFDGNDYLNVNILEKTPVARVFTNQGTSFYIDMAGLSIPLSSQAQEGLPVFTGFPHSKPYGRGDSLLLQDVVYVAQIIKNDSFWTAQAAQIDMVPACAQGCWEFEMVPTVGNHIVKLGNVANMENKLNRLFVFYKKVMAKAGFDVYQTVDVRFANQVLGRRSKSTVIDSTVYKQYVAAFLKRRVATDTVENVVPQPVAKPDSVKNLKTVVAANKPVVKPVLPQVKMSEATIAKKEVIETKEPVKKEPKKLVIQNEQKKTEVKKELPSATQLNSTQQPKALMPKKIN